MLKLTWARFISIAVGSLVLSLVSVGRGAAANIAPSSANPAGNSALGFALSLSAQSSVVKAGDSIRVVVELRNMSHSTEHAAFGPRGLVYSLIVMKQGSASTWELSPIDGGDFSGPIAGRTIQSGFSNFSNVSLKDYKPPIIEPGVYTITARSLDLFVPQTSERIPLTSNSITVTVQR